MDLKDIDIVAIAAYLVATNRVTSLDVARAEARHMYEMPTRRPTYWRTLVSALDMLTAKPEEQDEAVRLGTVIAFEAIGSGSESLASVQARVKCMNELQFRSSLEQARTYFVLRKEEPFTYLTENGARWK